MEPLYSNVAPQIRAILQNQQSNSLTLRTGQVMLGKIKEILPNNVAVVQFGKHQVVAKLEIPITADQTYLFEVVSTGELPQLSVVSQSTSNVTLAEQIQIILANLNLNPTTENRQFVQELLANEVPVRQTDLKQALEIFKNSQTPETKELLIHLLKQQLPITEMTLNAVKSVRSDQSIISQMNDLYQAIEQQPVTNATSNQLSEMLTQFINNDSTTGQPVPFTNQQIEELNTLLQQTTIPLNDTGASIPIQLEPTIDLSSSIEQVPEFNLNREAVIDLMQSQVALTDKQLFQFKEILTQIQNQQQIASPRLMDQLQTLLKNPTVSHKIIQQLPSEVTAALQDFIEQPNQSSLTEFVSPLTTLIEHQLPITEMTLNAVKAVLSDQSITSQMNDLYQTIEQQPVTNATSNQLLEILTQFINNNSTTGQPVPFSDQQIVEFNTLLQEVIIPLNDTGASIPIQLEPTIDSSISILQAPELNLNREAIVERMQSQIALTDKQLFQFEKVLTQIENQEQVATPRLMDQLQTLLKNTTVSHKIIQQLPSGVTAALQDFIEQPNQSSLTEFIRPLTTLIEQQLPIENNEQIFKLLARMDQANPDLFPIKDQFIIHVKNYLLNAGLDYEHQIVKEDQQVTEQPASLKQLLLQTFSGQISGGRETEQLLNHITGQQLTLINETASFLHLSTSIPGLFGQEEDIEIEFYSRKDENEKIDPAYCRIAFYLELNQLKTTMIDMNVQNRIVHLTVYNDRDLSEQLNQFKPLLKQGLEKFNYQLSTTSYKPLPDKREALAVEPEKNERSSQPSRWDVKI